MEDVGKSSTSETECEFSSLVVLFIVGPSRAALIHGESQALQNALKPQPAPASNAKDSVYALNLATGDREKDTLMSIEIFDSGRECPTDVET